MKKFIIISLLIFSVFFVKMNSASAFYGPYNYDINLIRVVDGELSPGVPGKILQIFGWAVANNNSQNAHNIQPDYILQMVNKNGEVVYSTTDTAGKPDYSSPSSDPHDFNHSYYEQYAGFKHYTDYPTDYKRAIAVRDSGNYMYMNNNFAFGVGLDKITKILKENEELSMNLVINQSGGDRTVYGVYFYQPSFTVTIPNISAQTSSIAESAKNLDFFELIGSVTKITTLVNHGIVQRSQNLGGQPRRPYTYAVPADFDVLDRIVQWNNVARYNINTYKINYYISGGLAYNGGYQIGYIPATWSEPFHGGLTPGLRIIPKIDPCETIPECIALSEDCPVVCCVDLCDAGENEGSDFCNVCNAPELPEDICLEEEDATKQYCCYHPEDTELCEPDDNPDDDPEFPSYDSDPDNRSAVCSNSGTTEVKFKFPKDGWGHTLEDNQACVVSCEEEIKVTFQPTQSVRAGMGWSYPISSDGTRICAASYKNVEWTAKMNAAVAAAKEAYNNMKSALEDANDEATDCGDRERVDFVVTDSDSCCECGGCSAHADCSCPSTNSYNSSNYNTYAYLFDNIKEEKNIIFAKASFNKGYLVYNVNRPLLAEGEEEEDECDMGCDSDSCSNDCYEYICSGNGDDWDSGQSAVKSDLGRAKTYKDEYDNQKEIIDELNRDRNTCDNWISNNVYINNSETTISIDLPDQSSYTLTSNIYSPIDSSFVNGRLFESSYDVKYCNYGSHGVSKSSYNKFRTGTFDRGEYCLSTYNEATIFKDFWVEKSIRNMTFEFSTEYYVQRYTGELATTDLPGYDYDGRYSYTDFYTRTGSYPFSLSMTRIGPNLGTVPKLWSIDPFTCQYEVDNRIFPPDGDDNEPPYGNEAFMYRQISLVDPFPNRSPGENWQGKERMITSKGYSIYGEEPKYEILLNPGIMQGIRSTYGNDYGSFNINNPYKSIMVETYINNGVINKRR